MERIMIEVNKTAAKKWRASTQKEKRKIVTAIQQVLQQESGAQVNEPSIGYGRPSEKELKLGFWAAHNGSYL